MKRWLINLIKEAIYEQKLNKCMKIRANRDPDWRDHKYEIGCTWHNGSSKYILVRIEAKWIPVIEEKRNNYMKNDEPTEFTDKYILTVFEKLMNELNQKIKNLEGKCTG